MAKLRGNREHHSRSTELKVSYARRLDRERIVPCGTFGITRGVRMSSKVTDDDDELELINDTVFAVILV